MEYLLETRLYQFINTVKSAVIVNAENEEILLDDGLVKIFELLLKIRDNNRNL